MSHTPGPWIVVPACHGFVIAAKDGQYDVSVVRNIGNDDNESNAKLIARAPEMSAEIEQLKEQRDELLEALNKAQQDINWMLNEQKFLNAFVFDYIETAIAKATSK